MILVVCGVSGVGKSTIGRLLADRLDWEFHDADDYHPPRNVDKMRAGIPLTDDDRQPWLEQLAALLSRLQASGTDAVLACSALKQAHRDRLGIDQHQVRSVFLDGSMETVARRLAEREHEFMPRALLTSQFEALEPPGDGLVVAIEQTPEAICAEVLHRLGMSLPERDG